MVKHKKYIDIAKGIAMLLVVMGHVWCMSLYNADRDGWHVFKLIYHFHMPLFFFLSGLLTKYTTQKPKYSAMTIYKKFRQLVIPFFVIGITCAISCRNVGFIDFISDSMKCGYWYLYALFVFYIFHIFFLTINVYSSRNLSMICGIVLIIVFNILYLNLNQTWRDILCMYQIKTYYPYFFVAGWLMNYVEFDKIIKNKVISVFFMVVAPLLIYARIKGVEHIGYLSIISNIGFVIVCSNYLSSKCNCLVINRIENYGRATMIIYIVHYFIINLFKLDFIGEFILQNYSLGLETIILLLISIFIIEISYYVGKFYISSDVIRKYIFYK